MSTVLNNYDEIKTEVKTLYKELLTEAKENDFFLETKNNIQEEINSLAISDEKKADALIAMYAQLASVTVSKTFDQAIIIIDKATKLPKELLEMDKKIDIATAQEEELQESILDRQQKRPVEVANLTKQGQLLDKQVAKLDVEIDIATAQEEELQESILDRQQKRPVEVANLTKEGQVLDRQVAKLDADIDIATAQEAELQESILDRQQKRPVEVANLTKQGQLLDKQVAKLAEDILYIVAQKTSMLEQVQHNKIIKAMDSMGDMIGTLGAGGLVPGAAMFEVYFKLNKSLTNAELPTNYTVTKA